MRIVATVGLFITALAGAAFAGDVGPILGSGPVAAASSSPDLVRELLRFLGRLHPMVVHFPVALLICAGMLEILALRAPSIRAAARACIYIGAVSAVVAAGLGWLIAAHEPQGRGEAQILEAHRWTGIATAGLALIAAALAAIDARRSSPTLAAAYRYALFSAVLVVSFAGHMGGALVYGEDYALRAFSMWRDATKKPSAPASVPTDPPRGDAQATEADPLAGDPSGDPQVGDPQVGDPPLTEQSSGNRGGDAVTGGPAPVDFATQVWPIFQAQCFECHGPDKQEGDLALHERDGLFHDEPALWTVLPGKPDESLLIEMVELPADDPDFMPAEGEPLPSLQIAILRRWITEGAVWPDPGEARGAPGG